MNVMRHNIVTLALTVVVLAVTALNSFTLKAFLSEFHMNNSDLIAEVAFSESSRCDRLENTLTRLYRDYVALKNEAKGLIEDLSQAAHHIRDCHALLEKAGIKPLDTFALEQCPADCPKCSLKIQP